MQCPHRDSIDAASVLHRVVPPCCGQPHLLRRYRLHGRLQHGYNCWPWHLMLSACMNFTLQWLKQWCHAGVQHHDLHTIGQQNNVLLLASSTIWCLHQHQLFNTANQSIVVATSETPHAQGTTCPGVHTQRKCQMECCKSAHSHPTIVLESLQPVLHSMHKCTTLSQLLCQTSTCIPPAISLIRPCALAST